MPAVDTLISPLSFTAVKLKQRWPNPLRQFRADAERPLPYYNGNAALFSPALSAKNSLPVTFPSPNIFFWPRFDQKEVLTMSAIAQKMGHHHGGSERIGGAAGESRLCHARIRGAGSAKGDGLHHFERVQRWCGGSATR